MKSPDQNRASTDYATSPQALPRQIPRGRGAAEAKKGDISRGGGHPDDTAFGADLLLAALKAAGEPTRLRLLALTAQAELTVTELTHILGQSQPRVSRHLKLLCDAGLLERFPEGTWVFYRLARNGRAAEIGRTLVSLIPADSGDTANDSARLATVKAARADAAADYFKANATEWDRIRSLHVPEAKVEEAVLGLVSNRKISDLLDIGTGTGRILELLGPSVDRGVGVDLSREMLALARARLESAGLKNCEVRHADLYSLPFAANSIDAITCHQVLHFATDPAAAVAEAARVLRPGGIIVIVDFAPHEVEALRERHAHRRLGFTDDEVAAWLFAVGLGAGPTQHLAGDPLTVAVWTGIAPDEGSD